MKIKVNVVDGDFGMRAQNEDGNVLLMDASPEIGGQGKGMRPMQVVLSALAGCSAIDVISILKKQKQHIEIFDVEVLAERESVEEYSVFKSITLQFTLNGQVEQAKAERAVQLSFEKYCSVAKLLEPRTQITYTIKVNHHGR